MSGTAGRAGPLWPPAGAATLTGTVRAFDDERGVGVVVDEAGREYPFHCTDIADGSRRIAAGTRVAFTVAPGHLGHVEGRALTATA